MPTNKDLIFWSDAEIAPSRRRAVRMLAMSSLLWTVACTDPADSSSDASDSGTGTTGDSGSPGGTGGGDSSGDSGSPGGSTGGGSTTDSGGVLDEGSTADEGGSTDDSTTGEPATGSTGGDFGTAMSFFVTSAPVFDTAGSTATGDVAGDGDLVFTVPDTDPAVVLRGVEAADAFCFSLAEAAGSPRPNWVAYLSTHGLPDLIDGGDGPQIDARDRIGDGPWYNATEAALTDATGNVLDNTSLSAPLGVILGQGRDANDPDNVDAVAAYLDARLDEALILDEQGVAIELDAHDVFTGSDSDGAVYDGGYPERWFINERTPPAGDRIDWGTCNDWDYARFGQAPNTEFAQTGHTDVPTGGFSPVWNSAHDTQNCTVGGVASRGGAGHVYCFSPD